MAVVHKHHQDSLQHHSERIQTRRPLPIWQIGTGAAAAFAVGLLVGSEQDRFKSFVGVRMEETPPYELVEREGSFEIRSYAPYLVAEMEMNGNYETTTRQSFLILARYIFGRNKSGEKMSMTAPVLQEKVSDGWKMRFVMPSQYSITTLPSPLDDRIRIMRVPARTVAAVRFPGSSSENKFSAKLHELLAWIEMNHLKVQGKPMFARYDPPFTPPFLRRNEIQIPARHF